MAPWKHMRNISLVLFILKASTAFAEKSIETKPKLQVNCAQDLNKASGSAQNCFSVTSLGFDLKHIDEDGVEILLGFNPFAPTNLQFQKKPYLVKRPLVSGTALGVFENFTLSMDMRPGLQFFTGTHDGVTSIPDTSGLEMANSLSQTGYKQIAAGFMFDFSHLLLSSSLMLVFGNGEGHLLTNPNAQRYVGLAIQAQLRPGLRFKAGASLDGNSLDSEAEKWAYQEGEASCAAFSPQTAKKGFSSKRFAMGLEMDGSTPVARGLKAGVGFQRNIFDDLDNNADHVPEASCQKMDPDHFFYLRPSQTKMGARFSTFAVNASYRILDKYWVGLDYAKRDIQVTTPFFRECKEFANDLSCSATFDPEQTISQWELDFGVGVDLKSNLKFVIEYSFQAFDKLYQHFYYDKEASKAAKNVDYINASVSYNI